MSKLSGLYLFHDFLCTPSHTWVCKLEFEKLGSKLSRLPLFILFLLRAYREPTSDPASRNTEDVPSLSANGNLSWRPRFYSSLATPWGRRERVWVETVAVHNCAKINGTQVSYKTTTTELLSNTPLFCVVRVLVFMPPRLGEHGTLGWSGGAQGQEKLEFLLGRDSLLLIILLTAGDAWYWCPRLELLTIHPCSFHLVHVLLLVLLLLLFSFKLTHFFHLTFS